jgi:AmiR/NasT family two-component response regulator
VIEQAKGILISEHGIDADEAFHLLQGMSERTNIKLREVARRLVAERSGV